MRDHVIHKYFEISWNSVWDVISNEIPALEQNIALLLQNPDTGPGDQKTAMVNHN